jgi:hypothetical protein
MDRTPQTIIIDSLPFPKVFFDASCRGEFFNANVNLKSKLL